MKERLKGKREENEKKRGREKWKERKREGNEKSADGVKWIEFKLCVLITRSAWLLALESYSLKVTTMLNNELKGGRGKKCTMMILFPGFHDVHVYTVIDLLWQKVKVWMSEESSHCLLQWLHQEATALAWQMFSWPFFIPLHFFSLLFPFSEWVMGWHLTKGVTKISFKRSSLTVAGSWENNEKRIWKKKKEHERSGREEWNKRRISEWRLWV